MGSMPLRQESRDMAAGSRKVVLFVGENYQGIFDPSVLREEGYQVFSVSTEHQALRKVTETEIHVVVLSEALDCESRAQTAEVLRQIRPKPRVVMLYKTSISQAEHADAVLNVAGDPQDLVRTIRYLLTGSC
jgi:DNA-binding response OmpR family regulator